MYYSNKKLALICLFVFLLNSVKAQQASKTSLSLPQIWEKVIANNKALKMQDLKVSGTLENIKDAKAERLPEISAEGE